MDCSPPGSSIPGISQARILEWVAISLYIRSYQQLPYKITVDFINNEMVLYKLETYPLRVHSVLPSQTAAAFLLLEDYSDLL